MAEEPTLMNCPGCKGKLHLPEGKEDWVHTGPYDPECPMAGPDVEEEPLPKELPGENENPAVRYPEEGHPAQSALQKASQKAKVKHGTVNGEVINVDFKNKKRI